MTVREVLAQIKEPYWGVEIGYVSKDDDKFPFLVVDTEGMPQEKWEELLNTEAVGARLGYKAGFSCFRTVTVLVRYKQTNYQWLHSLTAEELAHFLDTTSVFSCTNEKAILKWLKAEHRGQNGNSTK